MQDLPWKDNSGPNDEVMLFKGIAIANDTYEFGVFNEDFYLIFEYWDDGDETITFRIDLNQYNTSILYTLPPEVVLPPGIIPGYPLFITLGISFTAMIFVVVYTLRKKKLQR